eukprot:776277_1
MADAINKKIKGLKIGGEKRSSRRKLSVVGNPEDFSKIDGVRDENKSEMEDELRHDTGSGTDSMPFKCFATSTKTGYVEFNPNKVNQDRALCVPNFDNDESQVFFGVFDGHGLHGEQVSQFLTDNMAPQLTSGSDSFVSDVEKGYMKGFKQLTEKIHLDPNINATFSGSTCITTFLHDGVLYTANVGDSRAILGRLNKSNKIEAVALSIDQKPEMPEERKRIMKAGGRVQPCTGPMGNHIGPHRVWLGRQDIPGLAMSRSFGDEVARTVGVISKPIVKKHKLKERDQFIVLGSDGVFEFLSNQQVADIVVNSKTVKGACDNLVKEATRRWKEEEEVIDDITAVVAFLK